MGHNMWGEIMEQQLSKKAEVIKTFLKPTEKTVLYCLKIV